MCSLSDCQAFENGEYHVEDIEAVAVQCTDKTSVMGWPFYKDVHYFFPRERILPKVKNFEVRANNLFSLISMSVHFN